MADNRHQQRIEGGRDWFTDDATGGGSGPLPFREVVPGLYLQSIQLGTGNAMSLETDVGIVQLDTGMSADRGREMIRALRQRTDSPVHTIVYSHGHTAYNHGVTAWLDEAERRGRPRPTIVAHENLLRRYERYRETMPYQEMTYEWQFGFQPGSLSGEGLFDTLVDPDETYRSHRQVVSGSRRVELLHCAAETDDGTGVWLPDDGVLYGGNATIGSFPNAGSPLRTPRDPRRWADTLDRYAALGAEILIREYGPEIHGGESVHEMLTTVRDALRYLRQEALARLNAGMAVADAVNEIEFPDEWASSPWMPQTYGCPAFVIQDVYRLETGWWNGNVASLHPAPRGEAQRAVFEAVDAPLVVRRARELHEDGRDRLALHVIDVVARAPGDEPALVAARRLRSEICAALAESAPTYMSANLYQSAANGLL